MFCLVERYNLLCLACIWYTLYFLDIALCPIPEKDLERYFLSICWCDKSTGSGEVERLISVDSTLADLAGATVYGLKLVLAKWSHLFARRWEYKINLGVYQSRGESIYLARLIRILRNGHGRHGQPLTFGKPLWSPSWFVHGEPGLTIKTL